MLQREIEALDREDFEVSSIALEDATPPERLVKLPSADNNNGNAGPSSLPNVSVDPEFACLLQEAGDQFTIDQAILDLLDTVFQ